MNKIKIDYALSVLDNGIKQIKEVKNEINLFKLELVEISTKLLTTYKIMLLDNYDEKKIQKVFIKRMREEYLKLYKNHCTSEIKID